MAVLASTAMLCSAEVVQFIQNSVPAGIVNSTTTHVTPANVTTVFAPTTYSGYSFTHWEINEGAGAYRVNDPFGRANNAVSFTIYNPTVATAYYLPTNRDVDADAVPDWYEIHYFGALTNGAASDGDGDGFSLLTEFQRGYDPLFADNMIDGGISRARSSAALVILDTNYFLYRRSSAPVGVYSYAALVTNGFVDTLPMLEDVGGYRFAYWTANGNRLADPFGRAHSTCPITITGTMIIVAHFFPITEDADSDGIPDWYEWHFFGTLANDAASDADADGYSLAVEYERGYVPHLHDRMVDGGLSRVRAIPRFYSGPSCLYVINSSPPWILYSYGYVTSGAQVATGTAPTPYSGWRFSHWTVNGERQSDALGVALDSATFVVTGLTYATANYMEDSCDDDADGIPDWYETYFFGDLSQSAASDSDNDGYSLAVEYIRGYRPVISDRIVDGGVSRSRALVSTLDLQLFERIEHILVNSTYESFFAVWPTNGVPNDYGDRTALAAGDWDGDEDLDFFVGASNGCMRIYENIGSKFRIDLVERTPCFGGLAVRWSNIACPYPALGDWDGDGYADLAVGGSTGVLRLISSTATFTGPHMPTTDYEIDTGSESVLPALADLTGDHKLDLLVVLADGTLRLYTNTGTASSPFDAAGYSNNCLNISIPGASGISAADINFDKLADVLVSDRYGRIWKFLQGSNGVFTLYSRVWAGTGPNFAFNLSVCAIDMDGDSDIDALCGYQDGGAMYLRNPAVGIPANLVAHGGASSILLRWEPNQHYKFRGFHVYRATQAEGPFSKITSGMLLTPEYRDYDIVLGTNYYYYVVAVSAAVYPGNTVENFVESPPSDIVSAKGGYVALWMPDYKQFPGQIAILRLNVRDGTDISATNMDIRVTYDPAVLKPVSQLVSSHPTVEKTALTRDMDFVSNAETANGELVILGISGSVVGDGHLFDINWMVNTGAVPGVRITNTFSAVTMYGTHGRGLVVDYSDRAVFTVLEPGGGSEGGDGCLLGDVDGDGDLDMDDHHFMMWLLRKDTREPTPREICAGDMNGDGGITHKDIPLHLALIQGQKRNP